MLSSCSIHMCACTYIFMYIYIKMHVVHVVCVCLCVCHKPPLVGFWLSLSQKDKYCLGIFHYDQ